MKFYTINAIFLIAFIAFAIVSASISFPFWIFICLLLLWIAITVTGSFFIRINYHLNSYNSNSKISKNAVAITFDDGPNPEFTPKVLQLLKKNNAKATFFLIGKNAEKYPSLVSQIVAEGHTIGNHSFSHSTKFGFLKSSEIVSEIEKTNQIVTEIAGKEMKFFRPPFGVTNPNIKKGLNIAGLISIGWNKRSLDTTNISGEKIFERVTKNLKKGDIILLHDSSQKSVIVLERLLLKLQQLQVESVTVAELLEIEPYV